MWMEDFAVVFDYTGSAGIFRIGGLCFLYSASVMRLHDITEVTIRSFVFHRNI